ncbi:hypothetical protein FOCC_FOCC008691 [Frankliniella occidentalis]|nr:hypothetical protein FOCC_FOCC008691 [Frankliniella occidentalis]
MDAPRLPPARGGHPAARRSPSPSSSSSPRTVSPPALPGRAMPAGWSALSLLHTMSPAALVPLALPLALPGGARRPRSEKKPTPEDQKDQRYLERRRRNNRAAKKSRDARRAREDQVALRAALLEHENAVLRAQVLTLREETHQLRQLLVGKPLQPLQPLHHLHAARRDEAQLAPPTELLLRRMMPV